MESIEELKERYSLKTNEELFDIQKDIDNYTKEAKEALKIVISERGGFEVLKNENELKTKKILEKNRIQKEVLHKRN